MLINNILKRKDPPTLILFRSLYLVCGLYWALRPMFRGIFILGIPIAAIFLYVYFLSSDIKEHKKAIIKLNFTLLILISLALFLCGGIYLNIKIGFFYVYFMSFIIIIFYTTFLKRNIVENDQIVTTKATRAGSLSLRILILVFVVILYAATHFKYPSGIMFSVSQDSLKFTVLKNKNEKFYNIYAKYMHDVRTKESYFDGHYLAVYDGNNNTIFVARPNFYYNTETGIMFGKSFETSIGKGGYFKLGRGEIIEGKFKPDFIKGTRFVYHPKEDPQLDASGIIIYLPMSIEELLLDKID